MSQISYLIKQDVEKTTYKKQFKSWYDFDSGLSMKDPTDGQWRPACYSNFTPVEIVRHTECTIIENPVLIKLRKKFRQAKIQIRERAFHMHGVAYVELTA